MRALRTSFLIALLGVSSAPMAIADSDQPLTVNIKRLSLETALRMARAGIEECRKQGVQVVVTVVDRGGHPQVVLRDVLAQDFALRVAQQKAYTAMTFNAATGSMKGRFDSPFSVAKLDGVVFGAGGLPIQAGGNILGGIGVSGAPSGETDEKCAQAGIDAVIDDLEMGD